MHTVRQIVVMRLLFAALAALFCASWLPLGGSVIQPVEFFISPSGNDSNAGTQVSPFLTPAKAQSVARIAYGAFGDVTNTLRGGIYPLTSTFALTSADSGGIGHPILWRSFANEKAILSGGVQVGSWSVCATVDAICNSGDGTTYQATVNPPTDFREFYFCPDGTFSTCMHRDRAHGVTYPAGFSINTSNGTLTAPGSGIYNGMASWSNPTNVEIVGMNMWMMPRCLAATISGSPPVVTLQTPCATVWGGWFQFAFGFYGGSGSYWPYLIENAYELLGASPCGLHSGCWYYNVTTHVLYYQPKAGENMATAISFVPSLDKLVTGSSVANVTFNRLTFAFGTWLAPNQSGNGYMPFQQDYWCTSTADCKNFIIGNGGLGNPLGAPALDFTGATHDLAFTHNLFTHNAGRSIFFEHGTQNVAFTANDCEDNGGGCFQYGDITDAAQSNAALQTAGLTASDNKFNSGIFQYKNGSEILYPYARNGTITQNEFDNTSEVSIATGWGGWTSGGLPAPIPNYSGNNQVTNNFINGYCTADNMWDCGGIYGNGATSSHTVAGNYIKGLGLGPNRSFAGIYPDEGSSNWTINPNVIEGPLTANNCGGALPAGGCGIYIWTSSINHITASGTWWSTSSKNLDNGTSDSIAAPTVFTAGSPPAGAAAVIAVAGISAGVTPGP